MGIEEVRNSFRSCIEMWGGRGREATLRPCIRNAFDHVARESDLNGPPFVEVLLQLPLSLIDIEKIRAIALACFRYPQIHHFFKDTAPTGPLGSKIVKSKDEREGKMILRRIQKAFLKTCVHNSSDFEDYLNSCSIGIDLSAKDRENLRAYLLDSAESEKHLTAPTNPLLPLLLVLLPPLHKRGFSLSLQGYVLTSHGGFWGYQVAL